MWLGGADCPGLNRLAFGAILMQPVGSLEDAYGELRKQLKAFKPGRPDPATTCDFFYAINYRVGLSAVSDMALQLNRLIKWSVSNVRLMSLEPSGLRAAASQAQQRAVTLDVDINTSPDFDGLLPSDRLVDIWDELVDLGEEIAAKGEPE
ncbi:MAG: hypothetical protein ACOC8E_01570, partial [Planctomycetota bacterium]